MSARVGRSPYRPSGQFDLQRLMIVVALLCLLTLTLCAIYFALATVSWYLLTLAIAFSVGGVSAFCVWAIRFAHCRNRPLALVLGIVAGLGGYLGHFHLDHVVRWGAPVTAVQRLPGYITFRMATDTWVEGVVLKPVVPAAGIQPVAQAPVGRLSALNWCIFLFETLTLAAAPAATALYTSRWPYSDRQRKWCSCESLYLDKESSQRLREALCTHVSAQTVGEVRQVNARQPHVRMMIWYSRCDTSDDADTTVFLSIDRRRPVRLELDEVAAFVALIPGLQALAGVSPVSHQPAAPLDFDPLLTHIWPVPPAYAGSVYTPWQRNMRCTRRALRLLGIPLLGMVLLFGGNIILHTFYIVPGKLPSWIAVAYIAALAFPLWFYVQRSVVPINFRQWLYTDTFEMLCDTIVRRPDPLVEVEEPGVLCVELLPRRLWEARGSVRPEESNEGLLRLDYGRGVALFEGENQRIVLPAVSIVEGQVEALAAKDERDDAPCCVLLKVRTQAGIWDLPFFPLLGLPANSGRDQAFMLLALLQELCDQSLNHQTDEPPKHLVESVRG
jgi:hypothetical protein